jgi:hypothetical protein
VGVSATGTKNQLIGSLQQNGDATRLELVWQFVEMNDVDWNALGVKPPSRIAD